MCEDKKAAPSLFGAASRATQGEKLLVIHAGLLLDGLSGTFHIFTKTMCRMAAGEYNLACDSE